MTDEKRMTIPLRASWLREPIASRANRAVKELRAGIARHTKARSVALSPSVNDALWAHGKKKPPAKLTVLVTVKDGVAAARLPDEKAEKPAKEAKAPKLEKSEGKAIAKAMPPEPAAQVRAEAKAPEPEPTAAPPAKR